MPAKLPTIKDVDCCGKIVLLRLDLNIPIRDGAPDDISRLTRCLPTVNRLLEQGAAVIIVSHFDRPKGTRIPAMSLHPLQQILQQQLGCKVDFVDECIGDNVRKKAALLKAGDVLLLENCRFYVQEEANDAAFAKALAELADIYVNDAFSASHRAHASISNITHYIDSYAGLNMIEEIAALDMVLENPQKPIAAIVGGGKVSSKLSILQNLLSKMDMMIIGGAMANTFLAAKGFDMGASKIEENLLDTARSLLQKAKQENCEIILPHDFIISTNISGLRPYHQVGLGEIPSAHMAVDIGEASVAHMEKNLSHVKTVLWNGPLGAFEYPPFDRGTNTLAQWVARATREKGLCSIAGGGDTVSALNKANVSENFTYLSTAGGAFLEWLEGKKLPGIEALRTGRTE